MPRVALVGCSGERLQLCLDLVFPDLAQLSPDPRVDLGGMLRCGNRAATCDGTAKQLLDAAGQQVSLCTSAAPNTCGPRTAVRPPGLQWVSKNAFKHGRYSADAVSL
jgi:hypothetical protein